MARERMAELLKYAHFEAISCHIMTYFMTCQICMLRKELWRIAISHPWSSDEDLAYTMTSATSKCTGKNYLSQIECWNLENEAKTTRKILNLSVNFVVPTSCQLCPYYSLGLSRLARGGKPSTRFPPERLVELIYMFFFKYSLIP